MTNVDYIYRDKHWVILNCQSLCYTPESNITLYDNYASIIYFLKLYLSKAERMV